MTDSQDPEDRELIAFGLKMVALEVDRKREEVALAAEADLVLDALEAGRAVAVGGWGWEAYFADLKERIDAAVAFPAAAWWHGDRP